MFDWLTTPTKDLPLWGQLLLDALKVLLGFGTVLLVTRWTLSRADRKDAISRQANALDTFSDKRIKSLHQAILALSKLWNEVNRVYGAMGSSLDPFDKAEAIGKILVKTEEHIDELMFALEEYGGTPGSLPSDYDSAAQALVPWLKSFYEQREGLLTSNSIAIMIGMCTDLQAQLRLLQHYELNMRLQVGLNPASAWNPEFGSVLETASLEFFTQDGPRGSNKPIRVVGTIVERSIEEDAHRKSKASRRILILGDELPEDPPL